MKVTYPGVLAPYIAKSAILYFTTDAGSDAFSLPFPTWYVDLDSNDYIIFTGGSLAFITKQFLSFVPSKGSHSIGRIQLDIYLPSPYNV